MRLGFLASNNGTGLRAVVAAIAAAELEAEACLVVSNRSAAPALAFAADHGIAARCIPTLRDPAAADEALAAAFADAGAELVILSGYLRKLGPAVLTAYGGRILNIHPALLPRHGGKGMYGRRVHEAVIKAGDRLTGASVHLVDDAYDHGVVVAQVSLAIASGETADSIERRVMAAEPELLVRTLQRIAAGELDLSQSARAGAIAGSAIT
ncbi:MAG TPA: formyltransferase family protein [Caulobacteraceae bacterium]